MKKVMFSIGLCMIFLTLFANLGYSATTIKTNKDIYYCVAGNCEPVIISVINDGLTMLSGYSVKINWDTSKGDLTSAKLPYLTTSAKNELTASNMAFAKGTNTFSFNVSAYGQVKFNISVYDNIGKLVYRLDPWFNESCLFKKNLTYSNNAWNGEDLINFPVLVVLNDTIIDYGETDTADIRFYDENGVRLNKEIEIWNDTGNSYVWVKDVNISGTDDRIEMYYACSDVDLNDYTDVWDKNYYLHVYHFSNASQDSSFYGENGTITGATLISSPIGNAYSYDGNDKITVTSPVLPLGTMNRTLTAFVKPISTGEHSPIISYSLGSSAGIRCVLATYQNKLTWWFFATDFISNLAVTDNVFSFVSGVLSSNGVIDDLYSNTATQMKADHSGINSQQSDLTIGYEANDNNYRTGIIDEVRIENVSRSAKWINATYLSMFNQYISFGEEEVPPLAPDYLQINYYSPDLLDISESCDSVNISIIPISSLPLINCSIWWNTSDNYTFESPTNNTLLSLIYALDNGTYNFSWDCYAGERGVNELYNSTGNYSLNVFCAYPPAIPAPCTNCTLYFPITEGWTYKACISNTSLYKEKIYQLDCNKCNYSEIETCQYGCEVDQCNATLYESRINLLYLIIALFIGIAIAIYIYTKIR